MSIQLKFPALAFLSLAILGACATKSTIIEQPAPIPAVAPAVLSDPHYEPLIQRGTETIDALRAQPAPAQPEVVEGKSELGDQRVLSAQGYVRIGNGRYAQADNGSTQAAIELGKEVGADKILLYPNTRDDSEHDAPEQLLAAYYVRFKLLFGATFRNLTAKERKLLGADSGVQIGSVVGGTPAAEANLMAGDFILRINTRAILDRGQFQELLLEEAGKPVTLKIRRGELTMDRVVRLGAMPTSSAQP